MFRELSLARSRDAGWARCGLDPRRKALLEAMRHLQPNGIPVLNGHARECAVRLKQINNAPVGDVGYR
jgi:hypothetical protein